MNKDYFQKLAEAWPSSFVARTQVDVFSGGLLNPRTLANRDSEGTGPKVKIKMGRKIAYDKESLIEWMRAHCSVEGVEG